ncbi:MAG: hypothetical protein V4801_28045 [Burkholderia gladioli]
MPGLLLNIVNGSWTALVANTPIQYLFVGDNIGEQETAVQQLSAAMQQGADAVINGAPEIFVIPPNTTAEEVVQTAFGTTDTLIYVSRPIYAAVGEDDTLLTDIVEAGVALADVL